jgi:hypothetical protein
MLRLEVMKRALSRFGVVLSVVLLGINIYLPAIAQSQRYPTNEEITRLRQEFQERIPRIKGFIQRGAGFGRDRRTQADLLTRQKFIQAWSSVSPNAAPFLGEWSGQENWLFIFPSNIKDQVCVLNMPGDIPNKIYFGIGAARNKIINIHLHSPTTLILDGGFLGWIEVYKNQASVYEHVYPKPLKSLSNSLYGRDFSNIIPRLKAAGCTTSFPIKK